MIVNCNNNRFKFQNIYVQMTNDPNDEVNEFLKSIAYNLSF